MSAYYRVGHLYMDTTANALYRCTTAGDKNSSVWAPIGGGGSVGQYTFVSDGGDYIVATAAGFSPVVTTLLTSFTNGATVTSMTVASIGGITAGQTVSGAGVPAGVTVASVNPSTKVVAIASFTATAASGGSYTFTAYAKIAKPPKIRCSIASETYIDGTGVHTFTYTAVTSGSVVQAYTRTNNWGGVNSEVENVTPAYLAGDLVYAMSMPALNMPVSPGSSTTVGVTLLDIHDKDWAT